MRSDFLKDLNPQQQKAVLYNQGPLLILAGAGSGKTRALTYKAYYLVAEKKINPSQILLVTFTNKAAGEMKDRIKRLLQQQNSLKKPVSTINYHLPLATTFHSFCAKILRKEGRQIGIPVSYLIYDKTDQLALIKQIMKILNISFQRFKPGSLLAAISSAKNELLNAEEYLSYARGYFQETAAKTYSLYQKKLVEFKALDFDDLIFKTVELFTKQPSILGKYQNIFQYIMVDEYHDTNQAQYQLTKLLANKRKKITVVADCSQSIYGWRGANFRNVFNLKNDFPKLKTINLEQNYRSSKTILAAAYNVIKQNTSHPILKLWTNNNKGKKIKIYEARDEKDEAQFVVNTIQSLMSSPGDSAVLYRTNAQSRVLEEVFLHEGLPYILIGGLKFYERKEIKDCLAYLRLLTNRHDMISYQRIEKLGKKRMKKFLQLREKIKIKKYSTKELLNKILSEINYWDLFNQKDEKDLARIENIKELFSVAEEFPQVTDFLEKVSLIEQKYLPNGQPLFSKSSSQLKNSVLLMTLHSAKGLEFKNVFIVGLEEGLFPHSRSFLEKDQMEEERRLAYVGITRAKENLYLVYSRQRLYFGSHNFNQISRFIAEIPNNLLESI